MAESKSDQSARHINEHFEKSSEFVRSPVNMLARFSKWLGGHQAYGGNTRLAERGAERTVDNLLDRDVETRLKNLRRAPVRSTEAFWVGPT